MSALIMEKNESVLIFDKESKQPVFTIGLGWNCDARGPVDLDASAFQLVDGKLKDSSCICYYGQKSIPGTVHSGDNRTGAGEGDDEQIVIDFSKIGADINEVSIFVTIYQQTNAKTFSAVDGAYIRVMDASGNVVCRYNLKDEFANCTAVQFGSLMKNGNDWSFVATGTGFNANLSQIASEYNK